MILVVGTFIGVTALTASRDLARGAATRFMIFRRWPLV